MGLIDEKPADIPSTNALDDIEADILSVPPAYIQIGISPAAMEDPPSLGETVTYCVRGRVTAEHGPIERKDGERRYTRTIAAQAIWKLGDPEPPDADAEQPGLFDEGDEEPEE